MRAPSKGLWYLVAIAALTAMWPGAAAGQGVTSSAVQGTVTREGGTPVESANVIVVNQTTGVRVSTQSRSNGRFNIENVAPGGPYTIEVRAIGFELASRTGVMLTLGQRYTADFEMKTLVVTLAELQVTAITNPLINSGRTGPASTITDTAIQSLPLLGRNFTSLLNTNPQVIPGRTGGASIASQNNRFNSIQVDGGVNNDIFGLPASGTPGGQAGAKPLSLEALKEFQVLVAPFDIRYGGFSGGLVNAVTKSGTNEFSGSLFGYLQRPTLVGADTAGNDVADFDINQYGFTFGGPIVRNKAHFFVAGDFQSSSTPFFGLEAGEPATGIPVAIAEQVRNRLQTTYGFDPGGVSSPVLGRPDNNFFAKLNWQLSNNHMLEVSNNYVKSSDDNFARSTRDRNNRDGWMLSNSGYAFTNKTNSTRFKLTSNFGAVSNELLVAYQTVRDRRESTLNDVPLILVQADPGNYIAAGSEKFSQANSLDQNVLEITNNLTFGVGNHQITIGTHNEIFSFVNTFFAGSKGVWTFPSANALDAAAPGRYELQLETRPGGGTADFGVKQIGGYVQDRFSPVRDLWVTLGLRFDVPFSDKPVQNAALASSAFGINTGDFPSGNVLISPRIGFNYDVAGLGNTVIRGGAGIFSGRPPYVWMSNAFTNTGLEQATLVCTGAAIPTFTTDGNNQPTACVGGGTPNPPTASINYFDPSFKFQQALKFAVGIDQQLGWGMVGTLDFLATNNRNSLYFSDDNVIERGNNGEGRMMYGLPNAAGTAIVRSLVSSAYRQVIRHENRSEDKSYLITAQLQKRFSDRIEFNVAYTYSKAKDLFSLGSSTAGSNLQNTPLAGTMLERELQNSGFDVPHKVSISTSLGLPWGIGASLIYNGLSGSPFAYTVNGDANGDGISSNDLFFVPETAADINLQNPAEYATLDAFIAEEACLNNARGTIMERNTCRNPWQSFVNMRFSKYIPTLSGQGLEISADIFNLLNLVNGDWGLVRESNLFEQKQIVRLTGYDTRGTPSTADDRGIYALQTNNFFRDRVQVSPSRWRMQLGAKYVF